MLEGGTTKSVAGGTITLLYDIEARRPACIILQVVARCDSMELHRLFGAETWITHPTPGMRRVRGTREEWQRVAKLEAT